MLPAYRPNFAEKVAVIILYTITVQLIGDREDLAVVVYWKVLSP
jgi:hypothetical protein